MKRTLVSDLLEFVSQDKKLDVEEIMDFVKSWTPSDEGEELQEELEERQPGTPVRPVRSIT